MKVIRFYKHNIYFCYINISHTCRYSCRFHKRHPADIQFKGGSILKYTYNGTIDAEQAGSVIQAALNKDAYCQNQHNLAKDEQMLIVNLATR